MIAREDDAELRYLVAEVTYMSDEGRSANLRGAREYRTYEAAKARLDALVAEGKAAVLQHGIIEWMGNEAAGIRLRELERRGVTWR